MWASLHTGPRLDAPSAGMVHSPLPQQIFETLEGTWHIVVDECDPDACPEGIRQVVVSQTDSDPTRVRLA